MKILFLFISFLLTIALISSISVNGFRKVRSPSVRIISSSFQQKYQTYARTSTILLSSKDGDQYYGGLDAFQILGVTRGADKQEIKSSYRKLVAQWHPDKFPDDDAKKSRRRSSNGENQSRLLCFI